MHLILNETIFDITGQRLFIRIFLSIEIQQPNAESTITSKYYSYKISYYFSNFIQIKCLKIKSLTNAVRIRYS